MRKRSLVVAIVCWIGSTQAWAEDSSPKTDESPKDTPSEGTSSDEERRVAIDRIEHEIARIQKEVDLLTEASARAKASSELCLSEQVNEVEVEGAISNLRTCFGRIDPQTMPLKVDDDNHPCDGEWSDCAY